MTITGNVSNGYFNKIYNASPEIVAQVGFEAISRGPAADIMIKYGHKVSDGTRDVQGDIYQIILRKVMKNEANN